MENPFSPVIEIEEHGAVRLVRLNRPEFLNAVNSELHHALVGIWDHLASDEQTRAAVITGNGRAFSAGGDMDHFKVVHEDREARDKDMQLARQLVLNALECPLPIVAAINGPAVGLGCSLAVLCDVVLMSEQAFIADPHVAMGLTAGDGGAPLWPLFMSMLQAKQYLLSGDRISAEKAREIGLATEVLPAEELLDAALATAERLASQPRQALESTKRALNMHLIRAATGVLDYALAAEFQSFDTPEHRAAVERFAG